MAYWSGYRSANASSSTEFGEIKVPVDEIEWAEPQYPGQKRAQFRGHFADLQTLTFALTDRHHSLASAGIAFDVPPESRKKRAERHGIVDIEYIGYNRQDVVASQALLVRVRHELELHGAPLAPWDIHSPASLAKSALRQMGITPPLQRAKQVSLEELGRAASAYFGGRAEARLRKLPVPVVHTDVTSMYPTVNTLAKLWELLTAEELQSRDATRQARAALRAVSLEQCLRPEFWPRLRFFAEVGPDADILPVRARYTPGSRAFTIGLNHLSSQSTLWYSGFDLAASVLLTGRIPRIRQAFTIEGKGQLPSLQPVSFRGGVVIDPQKQDFFRVVIEERHRIKSLPDSKISPRERQRVEKLLKVIANSGSYGVFAQFDPRSLAPGKPARVRVHGREGAFRCQTQHPEDPGEFCFPPLAAWITSAARLMLAIIERMVTDVCGTYLFTDTDSMAIVASRRGGLVPCPGGLYKKRDGRPAIRALSWAAVNKIIKRLDSLKPYGTVVSGSLLKLEKENTYEGKRVDLCGYIISAKRYCLYFLDEEGRVVIRKASEHVLGTYLSPEDPIDEEQVEEDEDEPEKDPNEGWIADTWRDHAQRVLGQPARRRPGWMARPAVHQESFTTPASLRPFLKDAEPQMYADQLKPFNFALRAHIAPAGEAVGIEPGHSRLLAPFDRDPRKWSQGWREEYSQTPAGITTADQLHPTVCTVQSMRDVVAEYGEHPETKSLGRDDQTCTSDTVGLLSRRHVRPSWIQHIGKEANRLEDVERGDVPEWDEVLERYGPRGQGEWEIEVLPTLRALGAERVAAAAGLSPRQVYRILKSGRQPPPKNSRILTRVALAYLAMN